MSRGRRRPAWLRIPSRREVGAFLLLLPEEACWRLVEAVFRWPLRAALAVGLLGLSPWAEFRTLGISALITLSGCVTSVIARGSAGRLRAESLPKITRGRYRQRRFKAGWPGVMEAARMTKPSKKTDAPPRMPRLVKAKMISPEHLRARVDLSPTGNTPADLAKHQAEILSKTRARTLHVTRLTPSLVQVDIRWKDPLAGFVRVDDLPKSDDQRDIVVGLTENGYGFTMPLVLPHLIVGEQGAGKSHQIWALLDGARRNSIPIRLRLFDPKGGQEFGELEDVAHQYVRDDGKWSALIGNMRSALETRQEMLRRRHIRDLTRFTAAQPLDILIVDEWLTVKSQHAKKGGDKAQADAEKVLSQGRAAGFVILAATQLGTKDMIGQLRDLFPNRYCMKVNSDDMVGAVLNMSAGAYPAHEIQHAGVGYAYQSGREIVRYRAAYLNPLEVQRVIRWLRDTKTEREAAK